MNTSKEKIVKITAFKEFVEEQNLTIKQAVDLVGIPYKSINYHIKKIGIDVKIKARRLTNVHDNYFNIIDTEKKAYILGFLIGDGSICLKSNRLSISNSEDDLEVLEIIKSEISPESEIFRKNNQTGVKFRKPQVLWRLVSKEIINTLINTYNILPNKTNHSDFEFPIEKIPNEFIWSFIRGFFDADGNISYSVENNNIKQFNFSFVFTSEKFANQIAEIFENHLNLKRTLRLIVTKNGFNTYQLRFHCPNRQRYNEIEKIYNLFYKNSTCFLTRKKTKFEGYLNTVLIKKGKEFLTV